MAESGPFEATVLQSNMDACEPTRAHAHNDSRMRRFAQHACGNFCNAGREVQVRQSVDRRRCVVQTSRALARCFTPQCAWMKIKRGERERAALDDRAFDRALSGRRRQPEQLARLRDRRGAALVFSAQLHNLRDQRRVRRCKRLAIQPHVVFEPGAAMPADSSDKRRERELMCGRCRRLSTLRPAQAASRF